MLNLSNIIKTLTLEFFYYTNYEKKFDYLHTVYVINILKIRILISFGQK